MRLHSIRIESQVGEPVRQVGFSKPVCSVWVQKDEK